MFNLVLKDLMLQKKSIIFIILYGFVLTFTASKGQAGAAHFIYTMCIIGFTYYSVLYADGYDERYHARMILQSLPLRKSDIVLAKYLSLICYMIFYFVLLLTTSIIFNMFNICPTSNIIEVYDAVAAIIVLNIFYSIYYPLYYRFGMAFMKFYKIYIFLFLILVPTFWGKALKKVGPSAMNMYVYNLQQNSVLVSGCVLFSIIILYLSFIASVKICNNTDL